MNRLDELEKALREYKAMLEDSVNMKKTAREEMIEELEKFFGLGGTSTSGQTGGTSQGTSGATGGTGDMSTNIGSLLGKKEDKEKKKKKKMDAVGEEDADIDNDGDVDSSDKYLKARREKISEAMGKKEHKDEKEDKKMIEEKLDEHNEKKHGEPKDEDSAMSKAEAKSSDKVKFKVNPEQGAKKVGVERSKTGAGPVKDVTSSVSDKEKSRYEQAINKAEHSSSDKVKHVVNPEQGAKKAGVERTKTGAGPVKTFKPGDKGFDERAKAAMKKGEAQELIKYNEHGQWSLNKTEEDE